MLSSSKHLLNYFTQTRSVICNRLFPENGIKWMSASSTANHVDSPSSAVDLAYASYENATSSDDKTPVIILHGFLGSKSNWNSLSKAIHNKTQRKVIAVDARNHGDSPHTPKHTYELMVADVVQLMKKLYIDKANLIGHSMGGRTAMLTSVMHPHLVSSLIVVDISPVRTTPSIYSMSNILDAMDTIDIQPGVSLPEARRLADQLLSSSIQDTDTRNFILTNLVQSALKTYHWRVNLPVLRAKFITEVAKFPILSTKYNGPTRFICGEKSDYVKKSDLDEIKNFFPTTDLIYIPNAGHWVHSQKPAEFLEHAVSFLNNV